MKFQLVRNLIVVDATINDSNIPMILDTGAAATIVSQKVAEELRLKRTEFNCEGMGAGGGLLTESIDRWDSQ